MDPEPNQQVIEEVRRSHRMARRALIVCLFFFGLLVVASVWGPASREGAYADAHRAMRRLDYARAVQIAEKLAAEHPRDYSAHEYLGKLYLYSGDLAKAEEAYSRAYTLYASDGTKTILEEIRKTRSGQTGDAEQEKYDEQTGRWDKMLDKYDEQNRRFDALLDKWEKQQSVKR